MEMKKIKCPYDSLPSKSFFPQLANTNGDLFLKPEDGLRIGPGDKIISFGSCFASKIKTICKRLNLNYLHKEDLSIHDTNKIRLEKVENFSLNYGNIYTSKHFLQLIKRTLNKDPSLPRVINDKENRKRNSFRPNVLSYDNEVTLRKDDSNHLVNIYDAIKESSTLVFTLGLTEHWIDKATSLCLPQVPGCGLGDFDNHNFEFRNSELFEVVDEIIESIELLKTINKNLSVILSLSPVPLVATYTKVSAVEANIYSKSLLRQAIALVLKKDISKLFYFPSFEIMTNPHFLNLNFKNNKRTVSDYGLNLIIKQFNQKFVGIELGELNEFKPAQKIEVSFNGEDKNIFNPSCDEENIYASYLDKTFRN